MSVIPSLEYKTVTKTVKQVHRQVKERTYILDFLSSDLQKDAVTHACPLHITHVHTHACTQKRIENIKVFVV